MFRTRKELDVILGQVVLCVLYSTCLLPLSITFQLNITFQRGSCKSAVVLKMAYRQLRSREYSSHKSTEYPINDVI